MKDIDATDCSRLGWLYLHLEQRILAAEIVQHGLDMEPENEYCVSLSQRLKAPRSQ